MNGLSDVRLVLRGQELLDEQVNSIQMSRPVVSPATSRLGMFFHRWATRKTLLDLDDDQLRDIGITRQQARAEGLKPFWRR
ncbi:MAG: DUF1127 domain-containing protein [Pseudomonas sp.]